MALFQIAEPGLSAAPHEIQYHGFLSLGPTKSCANYIRIGTTAGIDTLFAGTFSIM